MKKVTEPKMIKEENPEAMKDSSGTEAPKTRSKSIRESRCKTPDSPEGARQAPHSPNQSNQNPPSPSPINGNSNNECLTPPLPESVHLQHASHVSSAITGISNVGRPLVKVKKFLSTLVQFGAEIGADIGERVRSLVLNLVSANLSIEEFHHALQDVTNFPLRPFVLPFLRAHLPLLQREVHTLARNNKQSTMQYVRNHEYVVLDPANHSSTEISEIFMPNDGATFSVGIKRKSESLYENGFGYHPLPEDYLQNNKRMMTQNPFYFASANHHNLMNIPPHFQNSFAQHQLAFDYPSAHLNKIEDTNNNSSNSNNRNDEEWKNIHVMLNCILSMVEKTKRALTILQQRNSQDLTNEWFRKQDVSVDLKKAANEIMLQAVRQTEDRVAEVKKRAEDAVNDVKRQAVLDLQKAVAVAEAKANELIAIEKAKVEKLLNESRKSEENSIHENSAENLSLSPPVLTQPAPSQQNACWNCGRKAHETCSGCGMARYCGSFCQHKDWENHHQLCSKEKSANSRTTLRSATPNSTTNNHLTTVPSSDNQSNSKFKK